VQTRTTTIAAALAVALISGASAQTPAPANPVSAAVKQFWDGAKRNMRESADVMPEANYAFKPVDTVRSFGAILAHVAGANYVFCAAAKGEKAPFEEDYFEKSATTRAAIVKALGDSLAYCDAAYGALTDARGAELVDGPFGGGKTARAGVLMSNAGHLQEHYGNLVTYFRIKGIVPPSSRR
jgi:DinB family protein